MKEGYFGIGVENISKPKEIELFWKNAFILGANFAFIIGNKYERKPKKVYWERIPFYSYANLDEFSNNIPYDCKVIGVDYYDSSIIIEKFKHPERCIYLLSGKSTGLSNEAIKKCDYIIELPGSFYLSPVPASSIVIYDRIVKSRVKFVK